MASSSSSVAAPKRKRERKYWTDEEDRILMEYIKQNGEGKWDQVSKNTGIWEVEKTGNSCRLRWVNHLKPGINTGEFTAEEDALIKKLRNDNRGENKCRWSKIAEGLPGRTDNQVKNRWNTFLSKTRTVPNAESIPNRSEKVLHQVDNEPIPDLNLEINQDLPTTVDQETGNEFIEFGPW